PRTSQYSYGETHSSRLPVAPMRHEGQAGSKRGETIVGPSLHLIPLPDRSNTPEPASLAGTSLGALLRRFRIAAGLPPETPAERAISTLERGERHAPYPSTLQALATALGLAGPERAALDASVPGSRAPAYDARPPPTLAAALVLPLPSKGRGWAGGIFWTCQL